MVSVGTCRKPEHQRDQGLEAQDTAEGQSTEDLVAAPSRKDTSVAGSGCSLEHFLK